MSIRRETPCDFEPFICPYAAEYNCDCEYWCGAEEPEDNPEDDPYDRWEVESSRDGWDSDEDYAWRQLD